MVLGTAARAAEPKVNDQAHFFKQETVDKVDGELKQLKADTNVEVVVETFDGIPDNLKDAYDAAKDDADRKHEFYQSWMDSRGRELKLNGVYVLIVKSPSHLEVLAGHRTHEKAFPHDDQAKMTSILLDDFKAKRFDEGLQKAIDFARDAIKKNLNGSKEQVGAGYDPFERGGGQHNGAAANVPGPSTPTQSPGSHSFFGVCMTIGLIVIGAIILLSIFSRRSSGGWGGGGYGGPGYGGGYGYGQPRGGGFFSGLFGGLLGGAAGSYFENRMEDRNRNNYGGSTTSSGGDTTSSGGGQSDYGSTGGDFGSSSSSDFGSTGGDFGSSSSSDFGSTGGDFGGGGGDSGGGGGSTGGDF